jgi:hypothetical protein
MTAMNSIARRLCPLPDSAVKLENAAFFRDKGTLVADFAPRPPASPGAG